jgi:hypothetical protein
MAMQLDVLSLFGEDALTNHYNIIIPPHPGLGNIINLNLRVTNVEIPAQTISVYTITKNGRTMTRPSGVSEQGNTFTFNYRPDKKYDTYSAISRWLKLIKDPITGLGLGDSGVVGAGGPSLFRVPITVQALDNNDLINNVWTFTGCYPSEQSSISFSEDTGEPLDISVTMQYVGISYGLI